jgi:hypothetical protein
MVRWAMPTESTPRRVSSIAIGTLSEISAVCRCGGEHKGRSSFDVTLRRSITQRRTTSPAIVSDSSFLDIFDAFAA